MHGENYSGLTCIAGDSYMPQAMHSCNRAHRHNYMCTLMCNACVCLFLNRFPLKGDFYQLATESSDLWKESDCPAGVLSRALTQYYSLSVAVSQFRGCTLRRLHFLTEYIMADQKGLFHSVASSKLNREVKPCLGK